MNQKNFEYLLKRFSENSITRQEFDELMEAINNSDLEPAAFKQMEAVWDNLEKVAGEDQPAKTDELYRSILAGINRSDAGNKTIPLFRFKNLLKIAASLFLVLSIGFIIYNSKTSTSRPSIVYLEKLVPNGEKVKIILSDNSIVWLNSGSKFRYPATFGKSSRDIYLDKGEAFFEVTRNPRKPFIVHVGKVRTEVLGTAFNVEAYGNQEVNITVAHGKVKVVDIKKDLAVLTINKRLEYNVKNRNARTISVNARTLTAWRRGSLILTDKTLPEAVEIIERWYNVKIALKGDNLKNCRFTASFFNNESIEQVMNVLSQLNKLKYEVNNAEITVTGDGCS